MCAVYIWRLAAQVPIVDQITVGLEPAIQNKRDCNNFHLLKPKTPLDRKNVLPKNRIETKYRKFKTKLAIA